MIIRLLVASFAIAMLGLLTASAAAKEPNVCRPGVGESSSAETLVVLVDQTSWRDVTLNTGIETAVAAALRPGLQATLWRFGGLRTRALPQLVNTLTIPRLPDERADLIGLAGTMFNTYGHREKVRQCILASVDAQRAAFLAALRTELSTYDDSLNGLSPIVLALSTAITSSAARAARGPVTVLVISDGFEFSGEVNFYPNSNGRYLTAAEAQAKTGTIGGSWRGARIIFSGIGLTTGTPDTVGVSALLNNWRAIIVSRGGVAVELSTSTPQRLRE